MKLQVYVYSCGNCGTTFNSPELVGDPYGEFLMRTSTGKMAYLSSFVDPVFQEVENMFENSESLKGMDKMSQAKIFHNIFGVVCDRATDNSEYQIGRDPTCPKCHLSTKLSWHPTNPPELIDLNIDAATHQHWSKLSKDKKEMALNDAIQLYLNGKR